MTVSRSEKVSSITFPQSITFGLFDRFAYTVATVLLSTLVRQLKLHPLKGQVMDVRSELVSTPKEETWITVSRRKQK